MNKGLLVGLGIIAFSLLTHGQSDTTSKPPPNRDNKNGGNDNVNNGPTIDTPYGTREMNAGGYSPYTSVGFRTKGGSVITYNNAIRTSDGSGISKISLAERQRIERQSSLVKIYDSTGQRLDIEPSRQADGSIGWSS